MPEAHITASLDVDCGDLSHTVSTSCRPCQPYSDVRPDAPKDGTREQTNVLPELEERAFETMVVGNRREGYKDDQKTSAISGSDIIAVQAQVSLER